MFIINCSQIRLVFNIFGVLLSTFAVGKQAMSGLSRAAVHPLVSYQMILTGQKQGIGR